MSSPSGLPNVIPPLRERGKSITDKGYEAAANRSSVSMNLTTLTVSSDPIRISPGMKAAAAGIRSSSSRRLSNRSDDDVLFVPMNEIFLFCYYL